MTAQSTATLEEVFPGIGVFDCDSHYTEPADLWTSRAPAGLVDRVPQMRNVDGADLWFVDGDVPLGPLGMSIVAPDGDKVRGKLYLPALDQIHAASYDVSARLPILDRLGIAHQILYPNVAGFASARFLAIDDNALRNVCVEIYNDAMAELQAESGGRLLPQAVLPFWDIDAFVKEAERATTKLGLTGVNIPDGPQNLGQPDYGDDHWTPFWEFANERRLPLNFHIGSASAQVFVDTPWPSMGPERKTAIGATMLYMDNARLIVNLMYSDLLERFPGLRFVSVESGLGWIPFILEACEYQWDEMCPTEVKHHRMRPTEKFRQSIYACFWFEEDGPARLIDRIGVDNVLFETDFPHPTCLYPDSTAHLRHVLGDLDEDVRRKVLYDNAAGLYGVD